MTSDFICGVELLIKYMYIDSNVTALLHIVKVDCLFQRNSFRFSNLLLYVQLPSSTAILFSRILARANPNTLLTYDEENQIQIPLFKK